MGKEGLLRELNTIYKEEFRGQEIVLGEGNPDAELLLAGEAPGKDEVRLSRPFVGMAGKNLDEFLNILGIDRSLIYITNAIKFRLAKINEKTGRLSNRPAAREEIQQSREYLLKEIAIVKPKFIVTLGNVPLKSVTGDYNAGIGAVHGRVQRIDIFDHTYSLYPLYHPASIIYNQSLKEVYIKDIEALGKLISK